MMRSIYFYLAICCGAFALANIVWASPPGPGRKVSPRDSMPASKSVLPKATLKDAAILPKKTVDPMSVHGKINVSSSGKTTDMKAVDPKVHVKPVHVDPKIKLAATPALKFPVNAKFDLKEMAKIKPPVDLTKISKEKLITMKPPADFKVKPIALNKIQIPANALKVGNLNAKFNGNGANFILNQTYFKGSNYHLLHGVKGAYGWYYPGWNHHHWHHSIWDPACGCYYYYDPCLSCYYYWSPTDNCYYPCWWFVDYGGTNYPWWLCGGFESYGYHGIGIRIGW